jgi:quercetin dioxygenase-like cupin family protein
MHFFDLHSSQQFDPDERVEKVLATVEGGDFTVACWEPGQVSPYHCHPFATEAYFCFEGGGVMRTPAEEVVVEPGGFVVHPPGEMHEFENGPERSLLYRVRYGEDVSARAAAWRTQPDWQPSAEDLEYISEHDDAKAVFDSAGS